MPGFNKLSKSYYHFLQCVGVIWLLSINQVGLAVINQIEARIYPSLNYTYIIIDSNQILKYKHFILSNPERLVLNTKDIKFNSSLKKVETQTYNNSLYIKTAKVEQFNMQTVRMAFTLKKNLAIHIFTLLSINKSRWNLTTYICPNKNTIKNISLIKLKKHDTKSLTQDISVFLNKLQLEKNKTKCKKSVLIMLDPGHGGEDSGAIGRYLTKEKDVVLQIARRLKILIDHEHNMRACMTRYNDVFIPLKIRVAKAQKHHADLFISIHANAFVNGNTKGSSVFTSFTNGIDNTDIEHLVKIRNTIYSINRIDSVNDYYVNSAFFNIKKPLTIIDSLRFGKAVLNKIAKVNKLHNVNVKQAEFVVLKTPNIPSILVEAAFISNIEEENKLKTAKFQQEIAESILAGIKSYLSDNLILARHS